MMMNDAAATVRLVAVRCMLQQPFDKTFAPPPTQNTLNTNTTTIDYTTTTIISKSPEGVMATTTLGYPGGFTSAQWKELERQAMIYKYMVASIPVPPDLLLPFAHNDTADSSASHQPLGGGFGIFNLKYGNSKDPEPGRCKRTDGKKWRCSRDVAPHQKYCERHMHRGRPRSRKPVEVPPPNTTTSKKTRLHRPSSQDPSIPSPRSALPLNDVNACEAVSAAPNRDQKPPNRGLEWMMEGEMVTMDTCEQQWQQFMNEGSIYSSANNTYIFQQNYGEEAMNLLSLPDMGNSESDEYNMFLNSYQNPPRDFIDALSNDHNPNSENNIEASIAGNGNISPSSLNLSMAMAVGDSLDVEMGRIQMGTNHNNKSQVSGWLSPAPWMGSTLGGPLAEVLRPSSCLVTDSNPGSPYAGKNADAISPVATLSSSPSGVLHKTMLSLSDSSVCNSPTRAGTLTAAPEVGFQWLS